MAGSPIAIQTPYATAMPYIVSTTEYTYVDDYDAQRLASYDLYDDLYNNDPTRYSLMLRTQDEKAIYIPVAKRIINALSRYVGKDWGYTVLSTGGTSEQQTEAKSAFGDLFKRERVLAQFTGGKRDWLRRGDWIWYVTGDLNKRAGQRISLTQLDPRLYFPIFESDVVPGGSQDRLAGASIVEEYLTGPNSDKPAIKVQRWIKQNHPDHPDYGTTEVQPDEGWIIYHDVVLYDPTTYLESDVTKRKIFDEPTPLEPLDGITHLPLYHIRNNETASDPYGRSDLSGLESVIAGVNQATSDEDISLALMGIGQYWTDSGAPVNEETNEIENWKLGPNRVVEVDEGTQFNKVEGVNSIQPFQDHITFLQNNAYGINGLSDIAIGTTSVDTHVSQLSGIALAIHMQPVFDAADEKDDAINSVMTQLFHDLATEWFVVYEGYSFQDCEIVSVMDESKRLPFDRDAAFTELMTLLTNGVVTIEYVVQKLTDDFGYDFPPEMAAEAVKALTVKAAAADPFGARLTSEAGAPQDAGSSVATAQTEAPTTQAS